MRTVTIVGIGRVGKALSSAIVASGYELVHLVANDVEAALAFAGKFSNPPVVTDLEGLSSIKSDLLFITTQDSKIRSVAESIAALGKSSTGQVAIHCSGALGSDELSALAAAGYKTASLHPLVSVNDSKGRELVFRDVFFALEGDAEALLVATELVENIGGKTFEIPSEAKALYHAAAVVACGHFVALFDTSLKMLSHCGLDETTARNVMLPLVESTVANLREKDPAQALTGPFARGDVEVIAGHLKKIAEIADENIEGVYRILAREAIGLAERNGLGDQKIAEMREAIMLVKSKPK